MKRVLIFIAILAAGVLGAMPAPAVLAWACAGANMPTHTAACRPPAGNIKFQISNIKLPIELPGGGLLFNFQFDICNLIFDIPDENEGINTFVGRLVPQTYLRLGMPEKCTYPLFCEWEGVDKTVVARAAEQAGRPARDPFINTDRGDLLLLLFLLAGCAGGFVAGYAFRGLFGPRPKPRGPEEEGGIPPPLPDR